MFILRFIHASFHGRYAVVVVITTIMEVGVFALLVGIPGWQTWAVLIAIVVAFAANLFGHVHYSFRGHPQNAKVLWEFFELKVSVTLMRVLLYGILVESAKFGAWASYGVTFLVGVVSYVGAKRVIAGMAIRDQYRAARDACIALWMFYRVYKKR